MKNKLLLPLLLGFGSIFAWAAPEPASPKQIQVQVEFIELPHKALTKLLFLTEPKTTDGTAMRKKLQEMVDKDEAEILETQALVCKNEQKATSESVHEFIYATEYEPPGLPCGSSENSKSSVGPGEHPLPTAFETRNLGCTLEVCPTLSSGGKLINLKFVPELVWHTGNNVWNEFKDALGSISKVQMPDFYVIRLNTELTCVAGQYTMASVVSPKDAKGEVDMTRKVIVFVKCDVLKAE